jgi:hypothetical protein
MKKWFINELYCISKDGDLENFVVLCKWKREAKQIVNEIEFNADIFGQAEFSKKEITNFIPYNELTYEIICEWLENSIDIQYLDTELDNQIQNLINPPIVNLPLPFNNFQ